MLSVLDSIDGELYKLIKIVANGKRGRGRGGGFFDVYHFLRRQTNKGIQNGGQKNIFKVYSSSQPALLIFFDVRRFIHNPTK